jgi:putative transposase
LVRAGRTLGSPAKEFGVTDMSIRNWVRQADLDAGRQRRAHDRGEAGACAPPQGEGPAPGSARSATSCRVLGVSASGYHAWRKRLPSRRAVEDAELTARIKEIHAMSDGTYGAPRVRAELADVDGRRVGVRHVARLMRKAGLAGVFRRRFFVTTTRDGSPAKPDLVERKFEADGPNKLWVADITYVPTWAGFLFLAVVIDVWSRKVDGEPPQDRPGAGRPRHRRGPAPAQCVIHHSDRGTQYTSVAYGQRCQQAGVRPSMGSVGDAYDNALCESFFASLECELLDRYAFKSQSEARLAVFRYIEGWCNPHRRHSALDYQSPVNYERKHLAAWPTKPQGLLGRGSTPGWAGRPAGARAATSAGRASAGR